MMEVLYELKDKLDMKDDEFKEAKEEIKRIDKILERENIVLNEQFKIGLYSHIISFIRRLKKGEKTIEIGNDIISQIKDYPLDIAKRIVVPIFEKYKTVPCFSEIILVAIHIQTAIYVKEGRDNNGRQDSCSDRR